MSPCGCPHCRHVGVAPRRALSPLTRAGQAMSGRVSQQQQKQQAPMQSRCGVRLLVSLVLVLTTTCAVCAVADPPSPTDSSPQQVCLLLSLCRCCWGWGAGGDRTGCRTGPGAAGADQVVCALVGPPRRCAAHPLCCVLLWVVVWRLDTSSPFSHTVVPPRRDNNGGSNCAACQVCCAASTLYRIPPHTIRVPLWMHACVVQVLVCMSCFAGAAGYVCSHVCICVCVCVSVYPHGCAFCYCGCGWFYGATPYTVVMRGFPHVCDGGVRRLC